MTFEGLLNFVGFTAMVLFFSAVAGAGLYCGVYFAAKAWPFTINVTTKREGGR